MVSKTWNAMLVAVIASAMTAVVVSAEATSERPSKALSVVPTPGMSATTYRTTLITQQGLNNPTLHLTAAQVAEINKILDAHVAEQMAEGKKAPLVKDSRPSGSEMRKQQAVTDNLIAEIGAVMNSEQRKTWEAAQAERLSRFSQRAAVKEQAPKR